jgi:hypothetical protein
MDRLPSETTHSPYFQRPPEFGIDIVAHSTTRYINGHSDVVGGALIVSRGDLAETIAYLQNALGTCVCKRSQCPGIPTAGTPFCLFSADSAHLLPDRGTILTAFSRRTSFAQTDLR